MDPTGAQHGKPTDTVRYVQLQGAQHGKPTDTVRIVKLQGVIMKAWILLGHNMVNLLIQ